MPRLRPLGSAAWEESEPYKHGSAKSGEVEREMGCSTIISKTKSKGQGVACSRFVGLSEDSLNQAFSRTLCFSRASLQCDCQVPKRAGIQAIRDFLDVFI